MRKFSGKSERPGIDMTPMLDITFIMLIFFIVTAAFVKERGLGINQPLPNSEMHPSDVKQNILIRASDGDRICINHRPVDARAVRANIEQLRAQNPDARVVIQPAPLSHAGVVAQIYDQALLAGADSVALAEWTADAGC